MTRVAACLLVASLGACADTRELPVEVSPILYCAAVWGFYCDPGEGADAGERCQITGGRSSCQDLEYENNRGRPITTDDIRECLDILARDAEIHGRTFERALLWREMCDHYIVVEDD